MFVDESSLIAATRSPPPRARGQTRRPRDCPPVQFRMFERPEVAQSRAVRSLVRGMASQGVFFVSAGAGLGAVALSLFVSRMEAVCDEMGAVLRNAALSPNIRDRRDFSCAVFDAAGALCAQAAHIPVHLGSMAFAMADLVGRLDWADGDMVIVNDPFLGGTHLPDVTLIAPVFVDGDLVAFVVNRAHHADIGASTPGSMPLSRSLSEEGVVIAPRHLLRRDRLDTAALAQIVGATRNPDHARGDFFAQISANRAGRARVAELVRGQGVDAFRDGLSALNDYGERLARAALAEIPNGSYRFTM
jgi:N-methylhydantoinase B